MGGSLACPTVAAIPRRQFRLNRAIGTDLLPPDPRDTLGLHEASHMAARVVTDHFGSRNLSIPRVVLEPGRALTGDAQLLLTTVVDVKDDGELRYAVLDAGINVAEPVSSEYHQLFSVSAPTAPSTTPYRVVGPICTPADVLYNNWRLPPLEPGHVLAIMDSGAYFVPFSTTFSFPRPAIVMQDGEDVVPCRRRESFDDMTAFDEVDETDR
jgi:diaminopimelate decarboxylase